MNRQPNKQKSWSRLVNILACFIAITLIGCSRKTEFPESTRIEPSLTVKSTSLLLNTITPEITLTQTIQAVEDQLGVHLPIDLPAGQYLGYSKMSPNSKSETDLAYYAVDLRSGASFLIIENVLTATVSPDSKKLAFVRDNVLYYYNQEKGENGALSPLVRLPEDITKCEMPVWSPNSLKFLLGCEGLFESKIIFLVEKGVAKELLLAKWCQGFSFSWSPDSERFASACSQPGEARTDVRIFAKPDESGRVIPGCELNILCNRPSWSPLGNLILFFKGSGRSGEVPPDAGYYLIDPDCKDTSSKCARGATNPIVGGEHPSWSPSGTEFALADGRSIIVAEIGTGKTRVVHSLNHVTSNLLWSPDGHSLIFTDTNIMTMLNLETGELTKIAEGNLILPIGWISRLP